MSKKIAVIGGDMRQAVAASMLSQKYETAVCGFELYDEEIGFATRCGKVADAVKDAAAVILPLPYSRDKLHIFAPLSRKEIMSEEVFSSIDADALLCGGMLDETCFSRHPDSCDYYEREDLQIFNAIPTAEGAIGIAFDEMPITLFGSESIVIGYGRVAKILASKLKALGSNVSVCARSQNERAYAEAFGYSAYPLSVLGDCLIKADVIFNTVPSRVIGEELFGFINTDTPVIDLASKPGGIDFEKAKQHGLNVIWALSLPGKVAPVTAGKYINNAVDAILTERGIK